VWATLLIKSRSIRAQRSAIFYLPPEHSPRENLSMKKYLFASQPLSTALGLFTLRVALGITMLFAHGLPKLYSYSEKSSQFADPFGIGSEISLALAIFAEVFCSIGLITGLAMRWATIPLIVTMSVAFFWVHGDDPWQKRELSFVYLTAFVTLFFTGPGALSLDHLFGTKSHKPKKH